ARTNGATTSDALRLMKVMLSSVGERYAKTMIAFRKRSLSEVQSKDDVEDMPAEGSLEADGFSPPQFLNKIKPEYTADADLAGINATVDAEAEFLADGSVGKIKITRWAGFGLEHSAETAIKSLKFKP